MDGGMEANGLGAAVVDAPAGKQAVASSIPAPLISQSARHFPRATLSRAKRTTDAVLSLLLLVFFLPLMLVIVAGLFLADGAPLVFGHERIGLNGRKFRCLKFRTMVRDADQRLQALLASSPEARAEWLEGQKLKNDPRVHRFGDFLRRYSLDELPQLVNVLRGDMSLVGPRPIVQAEAPRYGDGFEDYTLVRPGLTGLWQVSGRSDATYEQRVAYDVEYVRDWTYRRDIVILFRTMSVVLMRRGAY